MIRAIREMGDPVLEQMAREVMPEEIGTPELETIIDDLVATLRSTTGVGMAAPQIGESLRICIVDKPLTVLINPIITPFGEETDTSWEGCLSVPGMRGEVRRAQTVRVEAIGRRGQKIDALWTKFRAIVAQHEVDHLNGILYVSRMHGELTPDATVAPKRDVEVPLEAKGTGIRGRKTFVVDSEKPVGGKQYVGFKFLERGRLTGLRLQPGGALVTGVWLSGVRLRKAGYKAGGAEEAIVGMQGLHLAAGDQLRIELQIPKGKRRIVAEADVDVT
jgi:peptide deformylase